MEDACKRADYPADCLTITYEYYGVDKLGARQPIGNPGTGYRDLDLYASCAVDEVIPPTGEGQEVPPETVVTVVIVCEPLESTPPDDPDTPPDDPDIPPDDEG